MNLSQIRTLASLFANDPQQTRFPNLYTDVINRAQEQFCFDSKALFKDASTYTVVSGTAGYSLPSDFWLEKQVTHKGIELTPVTRATLQFHNPDDWTNDTGTPKHYLIDPEEARKQILLYPIPQGDDAGANLILTYYPIPAALSNDTDTPLNSSALMTQFHIGIASYAAWLLLGYESATPEIVSKRADLFKQYQDMVTEAVDYFGAARVVTTAFLFGLGAARKLKR